eukprot:GHVQ01016100.1.p2 GENE.GHVQ01016100.1~~GHVQ01016100.1.p2  ORF type:complete len:136 (-),score=17.06 GHVQ01016100.1:220-627(-)
MHICKRRVDQQRYVSWKPCPGDEPESSVLGKQKRREHSQQSMYGTLKTYTYIYSGSDIHTHTHVHIHMHTSKNAYTHIDTGTHNTHNSTQTYKPTRTQPRASTCPHIHKHSQVDTGAWTHKIQHTVAIMSSSLHT